MADDNSLSPDGGEVPQDIEEYLWNLFDTFDPGNGSNKDQRRQVIEAMVAASYEAKGELDEEDRNEIVKDLVEEEFLVQLEVEMEILQQIDFGEGEARRVDPVAFQKDYEEATQRSIEKFKERVMKEIDECLLARSQTSPPTH